jgi:hypothetical protein
MDILSLWHSAFRVASDPDHVHQLRAIGGCSPADAHRQQITGRHAEEALGTVGRFSCKPTAGENILDLVGACVYNVFAEYPGGFDQLERVRRRANSHLSKWYAKKVEGLNPVVTGIGNEYLAAKPGD